MKKRVIIAGGGWGGLTAAHILRGLLPADWRITIIEKRSSFVFYPSFLRAMIGEKPGLQEVESPMTALQRKDIEIIREEITGINAEKKSVQTSARNYEADFLILALGAELFPGQIPGFREAAIDLYSTEGAYDIHNRLSCFTGGEIVFLITRLPFRCPPAPYEAAMLTEAFLRQKGIRNKTEISIYSPEKQPMPVAGPEVGDIFRNMLTAKNIHYHPEHKVESIDVANHTLLFSGDKKRSYDLLIGVPPHGAPVAVSNSGLTDASGYIPVHPQTMQLLADAGDLSTKFPGVYAIGDTTAIRLMNGMMLPKAGVFAEEQAHVVAANIAATVKGEKPESKFPGKGVCYVDVGDGNAAEGSGDFYAYPAPWIKLEAPSPEARHAKHEFERIFELWFTKNSQ